WAISTRETYGSGLLTFHIFCDSKNIPENQCAPAEPSLILAFLSALASLYSDSTVSNYLHGIRAWYIIHGVSWSLMDDEVNALLKAATSLALPTSKCPPHEPFTINTILLIHNQLNLSLPLHTAVFTCLTTTFYATARVGKFTVATLHSFNPATHVKCSDISIQHNRQNLEVYNFHLPHTKSAPLGEDVSWAKQSGLSDPLSALENHLAINDPPSSDALFAYWHNNSHRPLTKKKFISVLANAATQVGTKPLQGHGIHIGSTLKYLLRNVPFDVVKVKGCWASNAFLVYLHWHAQILALFIQAQPLIHEAFLCYMMPPVH
ncbi:hypothetical protein BDN67DRAFT_912135, partial [Paxillus ammoniavirescens]